LFSVEISEKMDSPRALCPHCGKELESFRNPVPTVDVIIEMGDGVVLIRRSNPPPGWALPGGFVEYGESLESAAVREAFEETGLRVKLLEQFHTYSNPSRDSRRHTISTVFLATAQGIPQAGDDAAEAAVFTRANLPPLAFDHQEIMDDYYRHRAR
jgi:ADP-ribose pyrophosphatase YjhB (NUDIX family)